MPSAARSSAMSRAPSHAASLAAAPPSAAIARRRGICRPMRRLAGARRGRLPGRSAPARRRARRCRANQRRGARTWSGSPQLRWNRMKPSGSASRKKARSSGGERRTRAAEDGGAAAHGLTRMHPTLRCFSSSQIALGRGGIGDRPGLDAIVDAAIAEIGTRRGEAAALPSRSPCCVLQPLPFVLRRFGRAHRAELQAIALPLAAAGAGGGGAAAARGLAAPAPLSAPAPVSPAGAGRGAGGGVAGVAVVATLGCSGGAGCSGGGAAAGPAAARSRPVACGSRRLGRRGARQRRLRRRQELLDAAAAEPVAARSHVLVGHVHAAGLSDGALARRLLVGAKQRHLAGDRRPARAEMRERPDADRRRSTSAIAGRSMKRRRDRLRTNDALAPLTRRSSSSAGSLRHQRISSTGSTPNTCSPEATTNATACTSASRARVDLRRVGQDEAQAGVVLALVPQAVEARRRVR